MHTWGQDPNTTPDQISRIAGEFSQARILMAHSLHGWWDDAIELARKFEHVYCELCAAHYTGGVIQKFVEAGIEDKVLYGSDLPWLDPMDIIDVWYPYDSTDEQDPPNRVRYRVIADLDADSVSSTSSPQPPVKPAG